MIHRTPRRERLLDVLTDATTFILWAATVRIVAWVVIGS